ncbi:MAG: hypothetical protein IPI04_18205 [Ignavibacteria bacterium]|nr:hypothetical protein [Ignavibacteria bacterium]
MKEFHLWNFIYHHISKNNSVILTAVVDHEDGSPGKEGFKWLFPLQEITHGLCRRGVMEYDLIKRSEGLLRSKVHINLIEKIYHSKKECCKIRTICPVRRQILLLLIRMILN